VFPPVQTIPTPCQSWLVALTSIRVVIKCEDGAVTQMGEIFTCNEEVRGSSPLGSIVGLWRSRERSQWH
jgi:hypothetical protein